MELPPLPARALVKPPPAARPVQPWTIAPSSAPVAREILEQQACEAEAAQQAQYIGELKSPELLNKPLKRQIELLLG